MACEEKSATELSRMAQAFDAALHSIFSAHSMKPGRPDGQAFGLSKQEQGRLGGKPGTPLEGIDKADLSRRPGKVNGKHPLMPRSEIAVLPGASDGLRPGVSREVIASENSRKHWDSFKRPSINVETTDGKIVPVGVRTDRHNAPKYKTLPRKRPCRYGCGKVFDNDDQEDGHRTCPDAHA